MNKTILNYLPFVLVILSLVSCTKEDTIHPVVYHGPFVQTITETGELAAVNAKSFVLPRYGRYWYEMKIIGLLEHGTKVEAGDSIIQLDPTAIKRFIIDRENELETQLANLEKVQVQISNRHSELHSALRSEQASFDLKKLELENFRFESEKSRKIKELEYQQAEIRLEKAKNSIRLYEIVAENDLQIQQIRVARIREEIKSAYNILPELTIRTPIPGIFQVARKRRSRELIKVGDEVYVGNNMGNVPDLTWMKAITMVNEADFLKISEGQKVSVRLDALPEVVFEGEITTISKLCRPIDNNARQKIFDVEVRLLDSDERLKPGMTVSCEYICAELDNVFYVPLNCIESVGDEHFIYLKKGNGYQQMKVKAGAMNNRFRVIEGEFKKGQELVPVSEINQQNQENHAI
ncbi:MAG: efflux RND transporter periplasmic adaptor subunit [Prolixibacteraceae bacterium]|nr:efflux RND transporter periplasmic adaptor subunit [Prolixibacteraceae bacterium]